MTSDRRREICILFGDPNQGMRGLYRTAMRSEGFENLHGFDTLEGFTRLVAQVQPDLIFMNVAMPGGDAVAITRAIRHGEIGTNPFVPIILTTWEAESGMVRRIIDSGADDLLVKPLSTQSITDRIQALAEKRKPFVVTADYIGPDRRAGKRSESDGPLIVVPNRLHAKLNGLAINDEAFRQDIAAMQAQVNRLRLKAAAFRVAFVATQLDAICRSMVDKRHDAEMLLNGLRLSVTDIRLRVAEADRVTVTTLCDQISGPVEALLATGAPPDPAAWQTRISVTQSRAAALLQYFNPDMSPEQLKVEVDAAVARFWARQAAIAAGTLPAE
ncbi:response regulator [uncultured Ferrovibrio sp.]|jgi:DNA-binding response OmpR family regulator|uniref:response regulator transcription factor n=1 Tax=uncultured Ferrovibrio sp. TaxID=1576913 RepID=UPI002631F6C7|nr:response regulator [uncultured Ferrovibrio sp.]